MKLSEFLNKLLEDTVSSSSTGPGMSPALTSAGMVTGTKTKSGGWVGRKKRGKYQYVNRFMKSDQTKFTQNPITRPIPLAE